MKVRTTVARQKKKKKVGQVLKVLHLDSKYDWKDAFGKLQQGRRDTSLVQHHDGITGTAKGFVAGDYLNRLKIAVDASKDVRL